MVDHEDKKLEKGKSNDFFCFIELLVNSLFVEIDISEDVFLLKNDRRNSGLDLRISLIR